MESLCYERGLEQVGFNKPEGEIKLLFNHYKCSTIIHKGLKSRVGKGNIYATRHHWHMCTHTMGINWP